MEDYSKAVLFEGDNPLGSADLAVFVAPPLPTGASRASLGEELLIPARARHTVGNLGRGESRRLYGYRR